MNKTNDAQLCAPQVLADAELHAVSGGDAAATRQRGQNSWGEWGPDPIGDIIRASA